MKVLWTFNPFDKNKELAKMGASLLKILFGEKQKIEIVYVASHSESKLATSFNIPLEKRYSDYPKELIKAEIKKLSLRKFTIEVLFEKSLSLTKTIKKLVDYSTIKKIDLIIISSNSKKKIPEFIFGSFSETLVHMSLCDLFIYHQKMKLNNLPPKNIIYAHDFSSKGAIGLEKLIEYAKLWDSKITIVHIPIREIGIELEDFKKNVDKRARNIKELIESHKIIYDFYIEFDESSISESILKIAKKTTANMIVVTATTKKIIALLGGSVTRQILRESFLPILILKV